MIKRALLICSGLFFCGPAHGTVIQPDLTFSKTDRIVVFAPHPDDEVLGTAGVIQRAIKQHVPVYVVFLTHGDNNVWSFAVYRKHPVFKPSSLREMGEVRREEAIAATKVLGMSESSLIFLGYPDHGTMKIWTDHWNKSPPFRSGETKVDAVPYKEAFRPFAPYKGDEILTDLKTILLRIKPTKVFVTHPADEHPDHRAYYLFLRVALWDLKNQVVAKVFPFLVHYQFRRWPVPQGYDPERILDLPELFLKDGSVTRFVLDQKEVETKYTALQCHRSQFEYSSKFLSSFVRTNEIFTDFPAINLSVAPTEILERQFIASEELPEDFQDEEKAAFVDLEKRKVHIENGRVAISIHYKEPPKERTRLMIYLFGYRSDTPFGEMPKIKIEIGRLSDRILNGNTVLPANAIELNQGKTECQIKVPLKLLKYPEKILTGVQSSMEDFPLDCMAWRTLVPS